MGRFIYQRTAIIAIAVLSASVISVDWFGSRAMPLREGHLLGYYALVVKEHWHEQHHNIFAFVALVGEKQTGFAGICQLDSNIG